MNDYCENINRVTLLQLLKTNICTVLMTETAKKDKIHITGIITNPTVQTTNVVIDVVTDTNISLYSQNFQVPASENLILDINTDVLEDTTNIHEISLRATNTDNKAELYLDGTIQPTTFNYIIGAQMCFNRYVTRQHTIKISEIAKGGTDIECNDLDNAIAWYISEFLKYGYQAILFSISPVINKNNTENELIFTFTFELEQL